MNKITVLALTLSAILPALAQTPIVVNITDVGTAKLGFLGQFQLQSNTDPVLQGTSDNFVLRRARILTAGTIGDRVSWQLDAEDANLGKVNSNVNGQKNLNNLFFQNAVITYKFSPAAYLDSGLLHIDPSHSGLTGAARFYGNDSSAYASLQNSPLGNASVAADTGSAPINREVGLSGRGLLGSHFEYHLALTNGFRNSGNDINGTGVNAPATLPAATATTSISSNNALRVTARVQYDLFDNEGAGYTTSGTYYGHRKIVSFGLGYDRQDAYRQTTGDLFVDLPVNGRDVLTFEGNYWVYDGGAFLPSLLKQKDYSLQFGYNFGGSHFTPIVRIEGKRQSTPGDSAFNTAVTAAKWTSSPGAFDEDRQTLGFAYWLNEHRSNLKVFYSNIQPKNLASATGLDSGYKAYHQITAQFQVVSW